MLICANTPCAFACFVSWSGMTTPMSLASLLALAQRGRRVVFGGLAQRALGGGVVRRVAIGEPAMQRAPRAHDLGLLRPVEVSGHGRPPRSWPAGRAR